MKKYLSFLAENLVFYGANEHEAHPTDLPPHTVKLFLFILATLMLKIKI